MDRPELTAQDGEVLYEWRPEGISEGDRMHYDIHKIYRIVACPSVPVMGILAQALCRGEWINPWSLRPFVWHLWHEMLKRDTIIAALEAQLAEANKRSRRQQARLNAWKGMQFELERLTTEYDEQVTAKAGSTWPEVLEAALKRCKELDMQVDNLEQPFNTLVAANKELEARALAAEQLAERVLDKWNESMDDRLRLADACDEWKKKALAAEQERDAAVEAAYREGYMEGAHYVECVAADDDGPIEESAAAAWQTSDARKALGVDRG